MSRWTIDGEEHEGSSENDALTAAVLSVARGLDLAVKELAGKLPDAKGVAARARERELAEVLEAVLDMASPADERDGGAGGRFTALRGRAQAALEAHERARAEW